MLVDRLFRCAFLFLIVFFPVRTALAALESVAPVSGGYLWSYSGLASVSSPQVACHNVYLAYFNYPTDYAEQPVIFINDTTYRCDIKRLSDNYLHTHNLGRSGVAPVCPLATPAYTYNVQTALCERIVADCPVLDTLHSKGFFNIGTSPSGQLLKTACVSGCSINLTNGYSPAGRSMISSVWYYFGSAEYRHTGQNCSPDTPSFLSGFVGQLPSGSCAAGQSYITMNGVTKCIDSGTGEDVNAASAAAAAKTLLDQKAQAAASAAREAATLAGADASAVVAAGVQAAADYAAANGDLLNANDPQLATFCADNPESPLCVSQDFGTVEDQTLSEKTINVGITPVSVGGAGSCPAPTPMLVKNGKTYYFEWTTYCNYANGIRPVLLAFAWLAAAGILVGGFRSA